MKALLISDQNEIIDFATPLLKEKGFDIIHYRWIIKALDNIEEIQPDIVVLSANEFPRHWKTLAGFVQSGIGGNNVKVYLYDKDPLSEEENQKAKNLGIFEFLKDFKGENLASAEVESANVQNIEPEEQKIIEDENQFQNQNEMEQESNNDFSASAQVQLAITDPSTGFIYYTNGTYFPDDNFAKIKACDLEITENQFIQYVSFFDGDKVVSFSAFVEESENDFIKLKVKDYYEKEI